MASIDEFVSMVFDSSLDPVAASYALLTRAISDMPRSEREALLDRLEGGMLRDAVYRFLRPRLSRRPSAPDATGKLQ
jgi:hypothetical protein